MAALFNTKARKWVQGRQNILERIEAAMTGQDKVIWVHCASLGEFEQGRPVMERLRQIHTGHRILLTFFSPSGYEARKDYKGADWVFYLPLDGPRTARRFLESVSPVLVIFVKYEFWYYYLKKVKYRQIPLLLVSALFWEKMSFFKWYGGMQRKMLSRFDHLFVQDQVSKTLLDKIGLSAICSISGDTRFDRVIAIAEKAESIPMIEAFTHNRLTIVAGSTWPEDEAVLQATLAALEEEAVQLIIAPHEITEKHLGNIGKMFPQALFYSQLQAGNFPAASPSRSSVLIIDNIGLLSRLYRYAYISYIGGGFGKGIHNTLEAAVYGKPVLFGPIYHKFKEAEDLIRRGAAISIQSAGDAVQCIGQMIVDREEYGRRAEGARDYVYASRGATEKIILFIQEKRLLTN